MSELKARFVVDVYYSYNKNPFGESSLVYLKSEADKLIAEKDKEIASLNDKALQYKVLDKEHCRDLNAQERHFALQIARHKYKRCLAMAMWCKSKSEIYNEFAADASEYMPSYEARFHSKAVLYQKWATRWLQLAEKFKEAK